MRVFFHANHFKLGVCILVFSPGFSCEKFSDLEKLWMEFLKTSTMGERWQHLSFFAQHCLWQIFSNSWKNTHSSFLYVFFSYHQALGLNDASPCLSSRRPGSDFLHLFSFSPASTQAKYPSNEWKTKIIEGNKSI